MNEPPLTSYHGARLGPVEWLAEIDSTSSEALRRLERGDAGDGLVLIAGHQTAGRGRRGRAWQDRPGQSLALSLVLDPAPEPAQGTMLGAVAVCELLQRLGVRRARLKWPNDVLVGGRKLCGILVESAGAVPGRTAVVGIGLNVGHEAADFSPELRPRSTSLQREGVTLPVSRCAAMLLEHLDAWLVRLGAASGPRRLVDAWSAGLAVSGREVSVELPGEVLRGVVRGFQDDGSLLLDQGEETPREVAAGHIQHITPLSPPQD